MESLNMVNLYIEPEIAFLEQEHPLHTIHFGVSMFVFPRCTGNWELL